MKLPSIFCHARICKFRRILHPITPEKTAVRPTPVFGRGAVAAGIGSLPLLPPRSRPTLIIRLGIKLFLTVAAARAKVARWQNLIPSFPLDCARVDSGGRNPRKGRDQILQRSGAIVEKPKGPITYNLTCWCAGCPTGNGEKLSSSQAEQSRGKQLSCCLLYINFLWGILRISKLQIWQ